MSERFVFGYGTSHQAAVAPAVGGFHPHVVRGDAPVSRVELDRDAFDWAFFGLLAFTTMLFFRPQDAIPALQPLHLAEVAALVALVAMVTGRLGRGLTVTRVTPEVVGVVAFGGLILATAPFSVWRGGAIGTFTDLYSKVLLVVILMVNTLRSPRRIEQVTWLIVVATGYLASRAVLDYARGENLVENGRVRGAVGGMFRNPNDLALNMVTVLPFAVSIALGRRRLIGRAIAAGCAGVMLVTVVLSHSRSGSIGLVIAMLVFAGLLVRRRPGVVAAGVLAAVMALPLVPSSYWHRLSSITDQTQDDTGSREARSILLRESYAAFLAHPLTGVGAGQFKNYDPDGRQEAWRESHNVMLQVAAELGVFGLLAFAFLVVRAGIAGGQTRGLLRRAGPALEEDQRLDAHSRAATAAFAGWFVCALFASVAYNWTFYYLLALAIAPREVLLDRRRPYRSGRIAGLQPGSSELRGVRA